jgi:hypothetical protein
VKRLVVRLAFAATCVGAHGCWTRTDPLTFRLAYHASASEAKAGAPHTLPCRIRIATVTDERPGISRDSLGDRGSGPVVAEQVLEWVGEGLNTLVERRLATWASSSAAPGNSGAAAAEADVSAGISVRRLYTRSVATDLEAVLALEVRYTRRDGPALQRDYRARAQKLNWFAAESEVQDVLNRALEDAVHQIAGDLGAVCAGNTRTQNAR